MATNPNNKDTIYIDVDDEITSIIDKVRASKSRIVALVLPKRASVLQSVVNMKLLKRTSDNAQKQVVLITSEAGLLPLAGAVGMYVANTLQSKPSIPDFDAPVAAEDDVEEAVALDDTFDPKAAAAVPVGELAADDAPAKVTDEAETIDLDDEADATPATATPAAASGAKKPKANKKLAVPNFNRFRLWLFLGALGLILLIFLGYLALVVLPKATVTAVTQTSSITTSKPITLSTQQKAVSTTDNILPANIQQAQKTASQQAAATGQKNNGEKAHGSATIINCSDNAIVIKAGTGLSYNGKTYITQQPLLLGGGNYSSNRACKNSGSHVGNVNVTAQSPGSSYNIENGIPLTVASDPGGAYQGSDLKAAANGTIGGGSDDIVKVVSQGDIDGAKQKLGAADTTAAKSELKTKLQNAGFTAIEPTFTASAPNVTSSASAGDQADTVTVTQSVTYSMFGVKQADLKTLVNANVKAKIDTAKQSIIDDGLSGATYKLTNDPSATSATVDFSATSTAGPKLNLDDVKKDIAGKKTGDVKAYLTATPGVDDVTVKFSPFWVNKVPKDPSKVTITFQKAGTSSNGR